MNPVIEINGRRIGPGHPAYVIAELSCNHRGSFDRAAALIKAAKAAGADAVKLQTYTPDTLTLDARTAPFQIKPGNTWAGRTLYELYQEAFTPWEWQPKLKAVAAEAGIDLFSSPFDETAVEFLERLEMPAFKVASFEIVDLPLIERIAKTGKPMILSTGLATLVEILEAVEAARRAGATQLAVLKCTSDYPARPSDMHLAAIPRLARALGVPVGLSDHTLSREVPQAAVALGACIIEKHLILSRADGGPDAGFSFEPDEFRVMVKGIRTVEQAIGTPDWRLSDGEGRNRGFRRSLFVVADVKAGAALTTTNVRSIRPADGLPPKYLPLVLGRRAARDIAKGTPLSWDLVTSRPRSTDHAVSRQASRAASA
ncbi:MAG: pseudaminic acid synthase [Candidatus Omnitrophica bacterium]|nr:pseudaminic acid synthase [Candidatus Omnitrophota bacterium]